jgi:hypothetical protein
MSANLMYRHRMDFEDGAILEVVVWRLPRPVDGCKHPFKYRLYYGQGDGQGGRRIIGFDNERPKGDHCHCEGVETSYVFEGPEKLIADFFREVEKRRT